MALQLGPVIGKIGGGGLSASPLEGSQTGTSWKTVHTVAVPAGETWIITATGLLTGNGALSGREPRIRIADQGHTQMSSNSELFAWSARVDGPRDATVQLSAGGTNQSTVVSVSGTVYTIPLED